MRDIAKKKTETGRNSGFTRRVRIGHAKASPADWMFGRHGRMFGRLRSQRAAPSHVLHPPFARPPSSRPTTPPRDQFERAWRILRKQTGEQNLTEFRNSHSSTISRTSQWSAVALILQIAAGLAYAANVVTESATVRNETYYYGAIVTAIMFISAFTVAAPQV